MNGGERGNRKSFPKRIGGFIKKGLIVMAEVVPPDFNADIAPPSLGWAEVVPPGPYSNPIAPPGPDCQ